MELIDIQDPCCVETSDGLGEWLASGSDLFADLVKRKRVAGGIKRCDAQRASAVERAGANNALAVASLVSSDVCMAMHEIIDVQVFNGAIEPAFMPVKHGEPFAVEFNHHGHRGRFRDADRLQVCTYAVGRNVTVSPDERAWNSDQLVEDFRRSHVAAVNHVTDAEPVEKRESFAYGFHMSVAV